MQTDITIEVLGPLTASVSGSPIQIPGLIAPTLLAILAFERGPQPRRTLVELLWGEAVLDGGIQEQSAYNRLYTATNLLRQCFGDETKSLFATDRGKRTLELVRQPCVTIDIDIFRQEARTGRTSRTDWRDASLEPCHGLDHPALRKYQHEIGELTRQRDAASHTHTGPARKPRIRIVDSNLVVIKAVLLGWGLDDLLVPTGYVPRYVPIPWGGDILASLDNRQVDIAIYNRMETLAYSESTTTDINILVSVGHSMGGRNFSVLANRNGPWAAMSAAEFLASSAKATFLVPARSDMYSNLLDVLCTYDMNAADRITVLNVPHATVELADRDPNILLVGGQNTRFAAVASGRYVELITFDMLDRAHQRRLGRYSENIVVATTSLIDQMREVGLENLGPQLRDNFIAHWSDTDLFDEHLDELALHTELYDQQSLVRHILYESYRFGSPQPWVTS